jgi:hypothetical protein
MNMAPNMYGINEKRIKIRGKTDINYGSGLWMKFMRLTVGSSGVLW